MLRAAIKDEVTLAPSLSGPAGKAWLMDIDAIYAHAGKDRTGAEVAGWVVEAAWAHPIWHSYWIQLIHLRPLADGSETVFHLDGATHELWVWALDPEGNRQEMIQSGALRPLTPTNFAAQFIAANDAAALERVETAVEAICHGVLSPDTDFRREWVNLFGDNMLRR